MHRCICSLIVMIAMASVVLGPTSFLEVVSGSTVSVADTPEIQFTTAIDGSAKPIYVANSLPSGIAVLYGTVALQDSPTPSFYSWEWLRDGQVIFQSQPTEWISGESGFLAQAVYAFDGSLLTSGTYTLNVKVDSQLSITGSASVGSMGVSYFGQIAFVLPGDEGLETPATFWIGERYGADERGLPRLPQVPPEASAVAACFQYQRMTDQVVAATWFDDRGTVLQRSLLSDWGTGSGSTCNVLTLPDVYARGILNFVLSLDTDVWGSGVVRTENR